MSALREAVEALGAMPEGYCYCSKDRIGDDSKVHEPECADLRKALASSPTAADLDKDAEIARKDHAIRGALDMRITLPSNVRAMLEAALTKGQVDA